MITRLVKMTFKEEKSDDFQQFVGTIVKKISAFDGCHKVDILRDVNNPNVFFTYSYWDTEEYLNKYRNSETFKEIWNFTKQMFNGKPEAWSTQKVVTSENNYQ